MDVRTGGPWTLSESEAHINYLELLAALKALQCFTVTLKDSAVELRLDNTTAVSYVNRLGGASPKNYARSHCASLIGASIDACH